jgi:DHA1 family bicyclomycin/chloramphenicol resistance-like MFS transporter
MTASTIERTEPAPAAPFVPHPGMGFKQFVAMVAALMAVNALGIDGMLPALEVIGKSLNIATGNQRQLIVTAYLIGFGTSLLAAASTSFEMLLIARALQGVGSAGSRVLAVSIVRDCYSGRRMARVMSLSFIVFLATPIIAPSFGQVIMLFAPWPFIFVGFAMFAVGIIIWVWIKLPETLHPEDRRPIAFGATMRAFGMVLTNRISIGYTLAMTVRRVDRRGVIDQCAIGRAFRDARAVAYRARRLCHLRHDPRDHRLRRG